MKTQLTTVQSQGRLTIEMTNAKMKIEKELTQKEIIGLIRVLSQHLK